MTRTASLVVVVLVTMVWPARAVDRVRVGVLETGAGADIRAALETGLARSALVLDAALVDAAARGAGYGGSTNLTREETRRLGLVTGADALALAVATEGERASDNEAEAFEVVVGLLLADARTGRLLRYKRVRVAAATRALAREGAIEGVRGEAATWGALVEAARERHVAGEGLRWDPEAVEIGVDATDADGLVPPRFFKRPAPAATEDADRFRVTATVDLVVQFNADGTYGPIDVLRWAGFGLDEAAIEAVRAARFWPARRSGRPIPARALLRYNFRFRDR